MSYVFCQRSIHALLNAKTLEATPIISKFTLHFQRSFEAEYPAPTFINLIRISQRIFWVSSTKLVSQKIFYKQTKQSRYTATFLHWVTLRIVANKRRYFIYSGFCGPRIKGNLLHRRYTKNTICSYHNLRQKLKINIAKLINVFVIQCYVLHVLYLA